MKNKKKKAWVAWFLSVLVIAGGAATAFLLLKETMMAEYESRVDYYRDLVDGNTKTVYVAKVDVIPGTVITGEMVEKMEYIISAPDGFFSEEDIGKTALVNIPAGAVVTETMVAEHIRDVTERETEYTCFYLGANVKEGDYIDVRIRFGNGEDFVVLAKKKIKRVSASQKTCFLDVTEEEIQMMASAIVDANMYEAVMYSNLYLQPELQEKAPVTYIPRGTAAETIAAIRGEKYTGTSKERTELEKRLLIADAAGLNGVNVSNLSNIYGTESSDVNEKGNDIGSDYVPDVTPTPMP